MKSLNLICQQVEANRMNKPELDKLYKDISALRDNTQKGWMLPKNSVTLIAAKVSLC